MVGWRARRGVMGALCMHYLDMGGMVPEEKVYGNPYTLHYIAYFDASSHTYHFPRPIKVIVCGLFQRLAVTAQVFDNVGVDLSHVFRLGRCR